MKTTRSLLAALAAGLFFLHAAALAITVQEGFQVTDFQNSEAAADNYVLDLGGNDFIGAIGGGDDDFFKVTVLPGRKVTLIQTSGSASTTLTPPLYAGTYTFSRVSPVLPGNEAWGFTLVVAAGEDYTVTTIDGELTVTDRSGFGDVLTVSEPFAGTIKFAAPGRTFSLNGAAFITGDSGSIAHASIFQITVNAGAGSDTIEVGAFSSEIPGLTLNGGTGDDTVNFTGDFTVVHGHDLDVDLQNDAASPGVDSVNVGTNANLVTSAFGKIIVRCSRNVSLASGASLTTARAPLTVEANQQEPATPGNFVGVNLSGAQVHCEGWTFASTALTVRGRGGNDPGGYQLGVSLDNGAIISGGPLVNMEVTGTGGAGAGGVNRGVTVNGAGSMIESTSATAGSVNVTGTGGPASANFGIGVSLLDGSIRATGSAAVTVTGTGAGAPGTSVNQGVEIGGGEIYSDSGDIVVRGTAGPGASVGLYMDGSQGIFTNGGGGNITLRADSLSFLGSAGIETPDLVGKVTIGQRNAFSGPIDLGGADPAVDKLSLTDAVLDRISTANLVIGVDSTTAIGTSAEVSPIGANLLTLYAAAVNPTFTGTDVTLAATRTLRVAGPLVIPITGAIANTAPGYPQLKVAGNVDLSVTSLDLTGTTYAGVAGNTFTLVENDGTDAIVGTFAGLPEGATFVWPGSTLLNARITYTGGSGNDVVLTLVSALEVTNSYDSGIGSLPDVLAYAQSKPGADTVTFHPSLSGATILLGSEIVIDDPDGVTVDASSLPTVLTIGGSPDLNRHFSVSSGKSLALLGLRFIGGHGGGAAQSGNGNAIANFGTLALTRCTLSNNTRASGSGGAILNDGGTLTLTQCTLSGNSTNNGGTIYQTTGSMTLTECTLSGNSSTVGGAIFQTTGSMTLTRCTLAANTAATSDGGAIFKQDGTATLTHCTLSGNQAGFDGGAIVQELGTLALTHCTVVGNEADTGGGIANSDGTTTLTHSIVAGNTASGSGPDIFIQEGSITGVGQNIVQAIGISGGNVGGNFLFAPPLLAPLGDYGGPTQTMALQPGSPAREAAPTSTATSDQRGQPIVGTPDIGAYETGIPLNYAAWNYETLPAAATLAERAPAFDFDGDSRLNVLEYATFTDGAVPGGSAGATLVRTPDGTEARFSFTVNSFATDLLYELQRSLPGVGPWVTIGDVNLRTSAIHNYGVGVTNVPGFFSIEFRDPGIAGQGKAFYRLQVSVP